MKRKLADVKDNFSKRQKSDPQLQVKKPADGAENFTHTEQRDTPQGDDLLVSQLEGIVSTKFSGKCINDLMFVEVFAGTARLSKVARDMGFQVLPIDKTNARTSQMFIAQYDLADDEAVQSLLDLLHNERDKVIAVHLAPACGTASKAREKKLSTLAKQGFKIPGPLDQKKSPWAWTA